MAEGDRHGQWLALRRVAALLDRLDIPHLGTEAGPNVWRGFLAHIIDAAEDGDIARARAVNEEWAFADASGGFNVPSPAPSSETQIQEPAGVSAIAQDSLVATV